MCLGLLEALLCFLFRAQVHATGLCPITLVAAMRVQISRYPSQFSHKVELFRVCCLFQDNSFGLTRAHIAEWSADQGVCYVT